MSIAEVVPSRMAVTEHANALLEVAFLMSAVDGHLADEAVATMILEGWIREGGGAKALDDFAKALPVGNYVKSFCHLE